MFLELVWIWGCYLDAERENVRYDVCWVNGIGNTERSTNTGWKLIDLLGRPDGRRR